MANRKDWNRPACPNVNGYGFAFSSLIKIIKSPDGQLKIPHLWPGQNPPPEVSTPPQRQGKISLQILDRKIHTFSLFHPKRFFILV
jgi:hypothetical protein